MRDLALRRITANRITITALHRRSHLPKLFFVDSTTSQGPMADSRSGDESSPLKTENKEEAKKLPEKLPPPPEKPLPGDCCGSGCVRCVWDVYYEELEEYNKLVSESKITSDSDST